MFSSKEILCLWEAVERTLAVSKDQTIKGNFFACVKISLCKLAHYILGQERMVKKDSCCQMHIY